MDTSKIRNMEELAAVSGVSRPTLSKFFNDPNSVRDSSRKKIEAALKEHDYRPNIYAINQNRRLTKNVGIMVPNLADPFFAEIARNIEILVVAAGYRPILMSSHGGTQQEIENLESLRLIRPSGALIAPLGRTSDRDAVAAFCAHVPTVMFDSNIELPGEAFVGHDNTQATNLIIDYLTRTGEPPIFFEMKNPPNPNAYKRRNAYVARMEMLGHTPHLIQVDGEGWDFERIGYVEGMKMISECKLPSDTILCSNDRLAIGLLSATYEKGLRVGRGYGFAFRIAGHDDHPFAGYTSPSLTTVAQDYAAIAKRSVQILFSQIEQADDAGAAQTTLFDGKLVMRASA